MTRILMDGFEVGLHNWTTSGVDLSATQKRSGSRAARIFSAGGHLTIACTATEHYGRFWIFTPPSYTQFTLTVDIGTSYLQLKSNSRWEFHAGGSPSTIWAGSTQMAASTGYLIEWYYLEGNPPNGRFKMRIDGGPALELDVTDDTKAGSYVMDDITFTISNYNAGPVYIDDFAINNTTGTVHHAWPGQGRIVYLPVDGNDSPTDWAASAGDQYACIDEYPTTEDTDYIYEDVDDQVSAFTLATDAVLDGKEIWLVRPVASARKTDAVSTKQLQLGIDSGGTVDYGPAVSLLTTWRLAYGDIYEKDLANNDWDYTSVSALKARVKTIAGA